MRGPPGAPHSQHHGFNSGAAPTSRLLLPRHRIVPGKFFAAMHASPALHHDPPSLSSAAHGRLALPGWRVGTQCICALSALADSSSAVRTA